METLETLTAEYQKWCHEQRLPPVSADELLSELYHRRDCLPVQIAYAELFLKRWEETERAETEQRHFESWRSRRQWFHDLRDSGVNDDSVTGPGYCYPGNYWIRLNVESKQELGRYWTMVPFDLWGDLEELERALWKEYGSDV